MIHVRRGRLTAIMTLVLSLLALFASLAGVLVESVYGDVVHAFTLTLSIAFGEYLKPYYGYPRDPGMLIIFSTVTIISLLLTIIYLRNLERKPTFEENDKRDA